MSPGRAGVQGQAQGLSPTFPQRPLTVGQAPCHQMLASAISLFALATGKPIMKVSTNQARRAPGTLFSGAFRVAFWNRP